MTPQELADRIKMEYTEYGTLVHTYAQKILDHLTFRKKDVETNSLEFVSVVPKDIADKIKEYTKRPHQDFEMDILDYIWDEMFNNFHIEISQDYNNGVYTLMTLYKKGMVDTSKETMERRKSK